MTAVVEDLYGGNVTGRHELACCEYGDGRVKQARDGSESDQARSALADLMSYLDDFEDGERRCHDRDRGKDTAPGAKCYGAGEQQ